MTIDRAELQLKYKILRFFDYAHLIGEKAEASKPFADLAYSVAARGKDPAETTVALRKLLEAKDAAVRSVIP